MTLVVLWGDKNMLRCISDSQIGQSGGNPITLYGPKQFVINVESTLRKNKQHLSRHQNKVCFSYAGSSLTALTVQSTLSSCLSQLFSSEEASTPDLEWVAKFTKNIAQAVVNDIGGRQPNTNPRATYLLFGHCPFQNKLRAFYVGKENKTEKIMYYELPWQEDGTFNLIAIGSGKDEYIDLLDSSEMLVQDNNSGEMAKAPFTTFQYMLNSGAGKGVGGSIQEIRATKNGVEQLLVLHNDGNGKSSFTTMNGVLIENVIPPESKFTVGNKAIGFNFPSNTKSALEKTGFNVAFDISSRKWNRVD